MSFFDTRTHGCYKSVDVIRRLYKNMHTCAYVIYSAYNASCCSVCGCVCVVQQCTHYLRFSGALHSSVHEARCDVGWWCAIVLVNYRSVFCYLCIVSHMLPAHLFICYSCIFSYVTYASFHMLLVHLFICYSCIFSYVTRASLHMLLVHLFICYSCIFSYVTHASCSGRQTSFPPFVNCWHMSVCLVRDSEVTDMREGVEYSAIN